MIIDCHGHFTNSPSALHAHRDMRRSGAPAGWLLEAFSSVVGDDDLRELIETSHLAGLRERGTDLVIFSPQASAMDHHLADADGAVAWARENNDLIHQVTQLFPDHFAGACQLPQTPDGNLRACVAELRRCADEYGFVGVNLNPDPSGGRWTAPPITDHYWYPLYEAMVELQIPAMIHASGSCTESVHSLGAHYLNADTTAFMQLLQGDLFADFPTLSFIIPHGGGAVPYHWGRFRGLAERLRRPALEEHLMRNIYFDTSIYHAPGIQLLLDTVGVRNTLFASEMLGAVRTVDPLTGTYFDDTKRHIDAMGLNDNDRRRIFCENALQIYPRLSLGARRHAAWSDH